MWSVVDVHAAPFGFDEAGFTQGTTNFTPGGGFYSTSPANLTDFRRKSDTNNLHPGQLGSFSLM